MGRNRGHQAGHNQTFITGRSLTMITQTVDCKHSEIAQVSTKAIASEIETEIALRKQGESLTKKFAMMITINNYGFSNRAYQARDWEAPEQQLIRRVHRKRSD